MSQYLLNEYELYEKAKIFNNAIRKKLGFCPQNNQADIIISALKKEWQEKLIKERLVIFEGIYGWALGFASGRNGTTSMLTADMIAMEEKK
jgi:hypothetical protein